MTLMSSMEEPDSFDLFRTFRSTYFCLTSAVVAIVLAGAYLNNLVYLSFTHHPNVWFFVADRMARALISSCTILGYFGPFVWPLGFASQDIERLFWRDSAQNAKFSFHNAEQALIAEFH